MVETSGNWWQLVESVATDGNQWKVVEILVATGGKWWQLVESAGKYWKKQWKVVESGGKWWKVVEEVVEIGGKSSGKCGFQRQLVTKSGGVIDLPLFEGKIGMSSKQVKYLRQSLTLTTLDGKPVFYPQERAHSGSPSVNFTKDIDPHGYLAVAAGNDYVHTAENNVLYYKRIQAKNNGQYDNVKIYRLGILLKSKFIFDVPAPRGHTDSTTILQTSTAFKKKEVCLMLLKWRVGYGNMEEWLSVTQAKIQRMEIDSGNGRNGIENMD
ncbi:hypothetical protein BJ912DRAFT_937705 [Pholiota molesta]|nr:hypothetical protein BJ912DRAFT_937705 [Pholiota molesta]